MRRNRHNVIWLAALGILTLLAVISPDVASSAQAALVGVFLLATLGAFLDVSVSERLFKRITEQVTARQSRISSEAREARERAEQRGSYFIEDLEMLDIGVITAQSGGDGLVMRRARTISKDDDGARPFVTLYVPPKDAERTINVRFEFIDHNGQQRYVHQMNPYLREGEFNILADHHLPLYGNDEVNGVGDWDLRVYINNVLVGLHNFHLTVGALERRERAARPQPDATADPARRLSAERRDAPISLEELLRGDQQSRGEQ